MVYSIPYLAPTNSRNRFSSHNSLKRFGSIIYLFTEKNLKKTETVVSHF
jgi:hypothetical protein